MDKKLKIQNIELEKYIVETYHENGETKFGKIVKESQWFRQQKLKKIKMQNE